MDRSIVLLIEQRSVQAGGISMGLVIIFGIPALTIGPLYLFATTVNSVFGYNQPWVLLTVGYIIGFISNYLWNVTRENLRVIPKRYKLLGELAEESHDIDRGGHKYVVFAYGLLGLLGGGFFLIRIALGEYSLESFSKSIQLSFKNLQLLIVGVEVTFFLALCASAVSVLSFSFAIVCHIYALTTANNTQNDDCF